MSSSHSSDDGLDSHDGLSSSSGPSSGGQRFLGPPESPTPKYGVCVCLSVLCVRALYLVLIQFVMTNHFHLNRPLSIGG